MSRDRQERLVAVLGHELRNPLAAAMTGVALAAEMVDDGDPRREVLDRALADLDRVSGLVRTFLEFGRARCAPTGPTDLLALARRAAQRQPGNVVTVTAGPGVPAVAGDPLLLERVLDNLLDNAVALGANEVRVHLEAAGDEVAVEVADDGPGVPEELRETIFEPSVSGRGSSGLGLAIVADVVAAHGGRISLLPVDRGAAFRVVLPAATRPTGHDAPCPTGGPR